MTAKQFRQWLVAMRMAGMTRFTTEAAALLGVTPTSIANYKKNGTDLRTALACAALLNRVPPYGTALAASPAHDIDAEGVILHPRDATILAALYEAAGDILNRNATGEPA